MSIQAMKQALEALEGLRDLFYQDTIEALRAAIEAAEKQEPVAWMGEYNINDIRDHYTVVMRHKTDFSSMPGRVRPLYTHPQPAIPDGWQLVPVKPVKTADPEISREHLVAIAEKCGLLGAYRTREVVDAIVGYGQVILRDKAVQEAMYRALLSTSPKKGNADV